MDYLPLFHNLKGRNILVIGGGEIALRKVRLVQEASAIITIVAKDFCPDLLEMDARDKEHGCNGLDPNHCRLRAPPYARICPIS